MHEKNGEHPFGDTGQLLSLVVFLTVWAGDSFLLHLSTFLSDCIPLSFRLAVFALTLIAATYLLKSGHAAVSREERPTRLIVTGAFRYVRHPLYLASILTYLGLSISTASLLALAASVGIFVFHNYIANYEEELLEAKFEEEYRNYKRRTGKWMPKPAKEPRTGKSK
ncbi:MAG: isoprenylcysteine carboxylmethyltransferase family protein [Deltaproteobacteria bacterium]|nr:isoprenylcysteine carboxylmethyltransferase family protein [Deltaproteobacteria bacterium]